MPSSILHLCRVIQGLLSSACVATPSIKEVLCPATAAAVSVTRLAGGGSGERELCHGLLGMFLLQYKRPYISWVNLMETQCVFYKQVGFQQSSHQGGEVYILGDGGNVKKQQDWRCDQYRRQNGGNHTLPKIDPKLCKVYCKIFLPDVKNGSDDFVMHAYSLKDNPGLWLIDYVGDENVYIPFKHSNCKQGTQEHRRTCPSVMEETERAV